MTAAGLPAFAVTEVEVTAAEAAEGVQYDLASGRLLAAGFEEPFVHFDEGEAPPFLLPAVRAWLRAACAREPQPHPCWRSADGARP
jgi:hypothetical protein